MDPVIRMGVLPFMQWILASQLRERVGESHALVKVLQIQSATLVCVLNGNKSIDILLASMIENALGRARMIGEAERLFRKRAIMPVCSTYIQIDPPQEN